MPYHAMTAAPSAPARRVVLLVLDGLRADLVGDPRFPHLASLARAGACTTDATTVLPSVTAVAMTSLLSGLATADHGVTSDRFRVPVTRVPLQTLPMLVRASGRPATGIVRQVPWLIRPLARRIVDALGLDDTRFASANAHSLLSAALPALRGQRDGLIVMHWPDCDAIGHRTGWMSPAYLAAVARMDIALGTLRHELAPAMHDTLLITLADHGGGGRVPTHHDSPHPLDCTIPILMAGAGVHSQALPAGLSLLDVPATVLWALGLPVPSTYAGTPIHAAFEAPAFTTPGAVAGTHLAASAA
ncbi:MAG: alkaline phosphatase family protein [Gemmatimonadaceae bacterium]|nr:alkaline phosphatase family protein [Gemmatimonadaceae bacterium]